ncbi:unnamed protein product [Ascophyllum nodosum]
MGRLILLQLLDRQHLKTNRMRFVHYGARGRVHSIRRQQYGQITDEFERVLERDCNTLLWLLTPGCTEEVQPVDAGYGRFVKVYMVQGLDEWLLNGDNAELWEPFKPTTSDRRISITQ